MFPAKQNKGYNWLPFWKSYCASWAHMQTGEMGRKKTIISVDADESMVIYMALDEYIEKHRREYGL